MSNNYISSTEFTTLCQSQMTLLTQGMGAVWCVIYLTEEANEDGEAQLFPFAIYPQTKNQGLLELPGIRSSDIWQQLQSHSIAQLLPANLLAENDNNPKSAESFWESQSAERKQLILPLIHQDTFIGLLVTGREDREWQNTELKQVEEIAHTIAIARFLDLNYHFLQEELAIQENLRRIEHDRLDNLLHQLRNPLTALRTFGKLLFKRLLPENPNRQLAQRLLEQSDRFQDLLEQFEAESEKIVAVNSPFTQENKSLPLLEPSDNNVASSNFLLPSSDSEMDPVDLWEILEPLLNTVEAIASEKNIRLETNIPSNLEQVKGDFSALREIFNNLIDNACKYTPSGGKVQLDIEIKELTARKKMLGVAIKDTGYGIPLPDQEHIFERHYRGVQAEGDIPGTGLGLAIAHELVTRMEGEIELISPNNFAENSPGTTFIVWLPVAFNN